MLTRGCKNLRRWGVAALTLSTCLTGVTSAFAQLDEIIVTAQKREQSLQDVPISVQAYNSEFLTNAGVDDLIELQFFSPGLVAVTAASNVTTSIGIRGLGTTGGSVALESAVGVYIDGVYRSRQTSAIGDLIDIERVEILKGPQGTLFGRNTTAGALQYITVAPEEEFGGWAEFQAGNLDFYNVKGAINIPLVEDKLATRFSGSWARRDGYVENITTGTDANERDRYQMRGQVLFTPTDDISLRIIGDYSKLDEVCCSNGNFVDGVQDATFVAGGLVVPAAQFNDDIYASNIDSVSDVEEWGISGELNWNIRDLFTFTSITAYRSFDSSSIVDADITGADIAAASDAIDQETFSQEVRFSGNIADRVEWVAGGFYFNQSLDNVRSVTSGALGNAFNLPLAPTATLADIVFLGAFAPLIPAGSDCATTLIPVFVPACSQLAFPEGEGTLDIANQDHESWAIFGQSDISVTEDLIVTLGLRYNNEKKTLDTDFGETGFFPAFLLNPVLTPANADQQGIRFEDTELSGTAKLSYFFNEDLMAYFSYSRGYKAGGTNTGRLALAPGSATAAAVEYLLTGDVTSATAQTLLPATFGPEIAKSLEFGMKSDIFDSRLRINAAIFRTVYDDLQQTGLTPTGFALTNAGRVTSQGLELDAQAIPLDWLSLSGSLAFVDARYDEFDIGPCIVSVDLALSPDIGEPGFPNICDVAGNRVQGTPQWSAAGSARVAHPIFNDVLGYGQIDIRWTGDTLYGPENDPNKTIGDFSLVNMRVGASTLDGLVDVSVWGKNVFDVDYASVPLGNVIRPQTVIAGHTEPRTYGVTVRSRF